MPAYWLNEDSIAFPPVNVAEPDGLLAVGGDLSVPRLLNAYRQGIFPWYSEENPILWWFTNPRFVIYPQNLHVSRSLKKILTAAKFSFTVNTAFKNVITNCALSPRPGQDGTWILPEMVEAYIALHQAGWAHSVEAWQNGKLAGGFYGVAMGRAFFGESMFYTLPDASKAAFAWFAQQLFNLGFSVIDCQQETEHMARFGATLIDGAEFSRALQKAQASGMQLSEQSKQFFKLL